MFLYTETKAISSFGIQELRFPTFNLSNDKFQANSQYCK
nr:MAG TPA: hypothetical protein [Caudoviricetes sp.]